MGENPCGKGMPGKPKLGGRDSIEAIDTMDTPEGARLGGLEAGESEESRSGDLASGWSLNWVRSVGAGGCGMEIMLDSIGSSVTGITGGEPCSWRSRCRVCCGAAGSCCVVTCSCPSCQHQTSVTAAAGWVPTVLPSPVCSSVTIPSRLRTGASLLPGSGPPLVLPSLLVLVAAFPYISSLFVARRRAPARPSPPWPAPPAAPAAPRTPAPPLRPSAGRLYPAARQVRGRGTVGTVGMGLETEIVSSIGLPPGFLMWGRTNGRRPGQGVTVSPHLHHW